MGTYGNQMTFQPGGRYDDDDEAGSNIIVSVGYNYYDGGVPALRPKSPGGVTVRLTDDDDHAGIEDLSDLPLSPENLLQLGAFFTQTALEIMTLEPTR